MFSIITDPDARCTDTRPACWVIEWRPDAPCAAGCEVVLHTGCLRTMVAWRWTAFDPPPGAEPQWHAPEAPTFNEVAAHNSRCVLLRLRLTDGLPAGGALRCSIVARPARTPGVDAPLWIEAQPAAGAPLLCEGPVLLRSLAGPACGLQVAARAAPELDGSVRVCVAAVDAAGFPTHFERSVPAVLTDGRADLWRGTVLDRSIVHVVPWGGASCIKAVGPHAALSGPINTDGPEGLLPLFGAIHWHTDLSGDGARTLEEAFTAARDFLNLDFAAPADHTPAGHKWAMTVEACERFNEPGHFATLYGYEQSSDQGHVNFYFLEADHPMNPDRAPRGRPAGYINDLPHAGFLAIPHHTNAVSTARRDDGSHYWTQYPWGPPRDYLRLVEVFQCRGNFEREDPPAGWRTVHRNHGASVQAALDMGHRLGFVGGTDNHCGWPAVPDAEGLAAAGLKLPGPSRIYTGVWAAARTREAVFEALQARRTWACWDTRAVVWFTVGGVLQGGELVAERGVPLAARIRMAVEAPLDVLEVVTNGGRVAWAAVDLGRGLRLDLRAELPAVERDCAWFYLRARQRDGALIYASPVTVRAAPA